MAKKKPPLTPCSLCVLGCAELSSVALLSSCQQDVQHVCLVRLSPARTDIEKLLGPDRVHVLTPIHGLCTSTNSKKSFRIVQISSKAEVRALHHQTQCLPFL